jgi:hypothetical protein
MALDDDSVEAQSTGPRRAACHPQRRRLVRTDRHRAEQGTKVFALAGRVVNTGLVEVLMGITLREVLTP